MSNTQAVGLIVKVGLSIRSEIAGISRPVERLMEVVRRANCVSGSEHEVEAALREAVGNAVIHGNHLDASKRVQVRACCEPGGGVVFVVSDEGRGFDAGQVPDPSVAANREAEKGRGIFLMKHFMDEVRFEQGGAEVHMRKGSLHVRPRHQTKRADAPLAFRRAS
jgi:serine/threonine-protein kinase RsbW